MKGFLRFFSLLFLAIQFQNGYSQTDTEFWFVAPEISKNGAQDFDIPIFFRISTSLWLRYRTLVAIPGHYSQSETHCFVYLLF